MSRKDQTLNGALVAICLLALGAFVVVLVGGCGADEPVADPLAGTQWQVQSYFSAQAGGMASPVAGTQLTASWADGQVSGSAGCNSYSATYTLDEESLTIGPAVSTKMACEQPLMDQETAFLNALASAGGFTLGSAALQILNGEGQVVVDLVPLAPAPEATQTPAAATAEPGAVDDSWERIQAAGKIIVGTAADYPPFEWYVAPGQIDGFDIALMDEIGRRLGVQISYRDLAFDGLGPALLQDQVDVTIAAISRTPEREVYADFSNVYLVGEGAALAQDASPISLTKVEDITKYKVGVQRNTVYKDQMETLFINTGLMSPNNLFAYEKPEDAIRDLLEGRLELVILDSQPAQTFVEQGGVKVAGIAVNQQYYAIALPKGAVALKAKIDDVITALFNDGTISALSERYLGDPRVLPTPTPAPTSKPGPTPTCTNGLTLVKHLTTESPMQPGVVFTKGWQVKNSGTCPWTTGYRLVFVDGKAMGGEPLAVAGQVNAGATYDLKLKLVAPLTPGEYYGVWQMVDAQGKGFGERLKVTVQVLAGPTVTPKPTQTPSPSIKFSVDRTQIKAGECANFGWEVQNVKELYFYSQFEAWQEEGVVSPGSSKECLQQTTTFYLRVVHQDNRVEIQEKTIRVEAAPAAAPKITQWSVDPSQIVLGQSVRVHWKVEGKYETMSVYVEGGDQLSRAAEGTVDHTPGRVGNLIYVVEAVGLNGSGTARLDWLVEVREPADPVTPEPVPEDPVIYAFDVTPNQIAAGDCVNISWSVGGGTNYVRIMLRGSELWRSEDFQGQQSQCLDQPGDYTYELKAGNVAKEISGGLRTVNVSAAPAQNPLADTHWRVTSIQDGAVPIVPDAPPTISFWDGGRLDGSGACMTYGGSYRAGGDTISISVGASSALNCSEFADIEARTAQDAAFLDLLPMATYFSLDGDRLLILDPGGQRLMELSLVLW